MSSRRAYPLAVLLTTGGLVAAAVATGAGAAPARSADPRQPSQPAVHGAVNGFATGDFTFLDALSVPSSNVAQVSVAQSAAGVSNRSLRTSDTLGQKLLTTKRTSGKNAYARGAGVSLNLGQADNTVPQAQVVQAEATSPARSATRTHLLSVPLAPVATADVQPDVATANTLSAGDFCVLGKPLSQGTSTVADAAVLPAGKTAVAAANGEVSDSSTEILGPNGHGALGLNSVAALHTVGITLFKGIAPITIKIVDPLVLRAFAGGVPGSARASFGSGDGAKDLLSVSAGGNTTTLTVEQVLGGQGATIPIVGKQGNTTLHLLNVVIGGKPSITTSADGTLSSAVADLVKLQVVNKTGPAGVDIGGPLGPILTPVLQPAVGALDQAVSQLQQVVTSLGLTKGVDLRIGHFEAKAQVPAGGIHCEIPVAKTATPDPVSAGHSFVYTVDVQNPYDCPLVNVRVDDTIAATSGVRWSVSATHPHADTVRDTEVIWNDVGPIPAHTHKDLHITVLVHGDSLAGRFTDHAVVTGQCKGAGETANGTVTNVDLTGQTTVQVPQVTAAATGGGSLPDTGGTPLPAVLGSALVAVAGVGAFLLRRRRRWFA